jgi:Transposase, Mutator family
VHHSSATFVRCRRRFFSPTDLVKYYQDNPKRPLEPLYPVVFFDALRVKIRDEATVRFGA